MKSSGFTLIELVVVIMILGILMAVAIPKYVDITEKAKRAADQGQMGALRSSTHMLYASNILADKLGTNQWPSEAEVWANLTQTNAWRTYTGGVNYYRESNGIWVVPGGE